MKTYTFTFIVLATVLLYIEYVNGYEICPKENCVSSFMCDEVVKGLNVGCDGKDAVCCSIVKQEYRTLCRHHGGACMDTCSSFLQQKALDCSNNQVCCVLV